MFLVLVIQQRAVPMGSLNSNLFLEQMRFLTSNLFFGPDETSCITYVLTQMPLCESVTALKRYFGPPQPRKYVNA